MSRSISKQQAAAAQRDGRSKGFLRDNWRRGGRRRLVVVMAGVWAFGSICVAYWIGEPWLRGRWLPQTGTMPDTVAASLQSPEADKPTRSAVVTESPEIAHRMQLLETRINDAVLRIDTIRSDVTHSMTVAARDEIAQLRDHIAAANQTMEDLRIEFASAQDEAARDRAIVFDLAAQLGTLKRTEPKNVDSTPDDRSAVRDGEAVLAGIDRHEDAQRIDARLRTNRQWAIAALALAVVANLAMGILFVARGRQRFIRWGRFVAVPPIRAMRVIRRVRFGRAATVIESSTATAMSGPSAEEFSTDSDSATSSNADEMLEEMRLAGRAGIVSPQERIESRAVAMDVVELDRSEIQTQAGRDLDVATENRLCMRFALRMSDDERQRLNREANEFDGVPLRSVA